MTQVLAEAVTGVLATTGCSIIRSAVSLTSHVLTQQNGWGFFKGRGAKIKFGSASCFAPVLPRELHDINIELSLQFLYNMFIFDYFRGRIFID